MSFDVENATADVLLMRLHFAALEGALARRQESRVGGVDGVEALQDCWVVVF